MKTFILIFFVVIAATVIFSGCGSALGLPDYNDKGGSFANYSTKKNIENYMEPSKNVYK